MDDSLLDHSMILFGSNLGNASNHSTKNLPILLAGGGFRHGQHLAFNADDPPPLSNLYVSMLQRLGIESDKFEAVPEHYMDSRLRLCSTSISADLREPNPAELWLTGYPVETG